MFPSFYYPTFPRWAVMWGVAIAIYAGLKGLTWRHRRLTSAPSWKRGAYLFAWPGMDVDAFLNDRVVPKPSLMDWIFAIAKTAIGAALLLGVVPRLAGVNDYLVGWIGLCGIVFVLHFGLFDVLSCLWRGAGARATPLMNWPIASTGVAEFWGKRWNLAFRDLTHKFLFRPLARRCGPAKALLLGFIVSGVAHDLVISLPAGGGYGLPTLYFAIQCAAILFERSTVGREVGLGHGLAGWLFCFAIVALPSPLLFHPRFVCGVVVPFLRALGLMS